MLHVQLQQRGPISLDAQLDCADGELLALVGPSGSGKSTILKTIAGLLRGDVGTVRVGGETWFDSASGINVPAHRRSVGYVFQSYALFPHMSVLHNVMATGASEASAREWIAAVRMKGLEHQRPARLSGGQQQRAALARALAREPKLLLLDEPFAAVDQLTRERLYEELADLRRRLAIPVVFVTHSLVEAQTLADHMVVLHRGRTLQHGTPEEIFRTPQSADIARLVAHKNILTASIVRHDANATHLQWSGVELIAAPRPELAVGSTVDWLIPALDVRLIWPEDVELSRRGNFFAAHIENLVPLGGHVSVHIRMPNNERLLLSVAAHIVRRRQLGIGGEVSVSLIPSSIHLMRRS